MMEQLSLFQFLSDRCIDCAHFSRWTVEMKDRPCGWYRSDTGKCGLDGKKRLTDMACDSFEYADIRVDDLQFLEYVLTIDNFDEPEIQARLDAIAERGMK